MYRNEALRSVLGWLDAISRLLALTALSLKDLEFGGNFQDSDKCCHFYGQWLT